MRLLQAALFLTVGTIPALAQRGPVLVVPGRPDVPVLMYGVDVSWAVIEGEFGLDRPGQVTPTVIYAPFGLAIADYGPNEPGYFPKAGKRPGYGRLEVVPRADRRLPPPAQPYYRRWSSESAPGPTTEYAPFDPPAVVSVGSGRHWHARRKGAPRGGSSAGPSAPADSGR